jgi:hypothetical protein
MITASSSISPPSKQDGQNPDPRIDDKTGFS